MPTVLIVHTVTGCGACNELKKPENFDKLKREVLKLDPKATIVIYEHSSWGIMKDQDKYPNLGNIIWAPTLMLTSSDNLRGNGDPTKVYISNGKYDAVNKKITKTSPQKSITVWIGETIPLILNDTSTAIIPPITESPVRFEQPKPEPYTNKNNPKHGQIKCKFNLVSYK